MDCKELLDAGSLLRKQQIEINNQLRHERTKLTLNDTLLARNLDLDTQIKEHGRAVRQSVELQNQADAALRRGDVKEAEELMALAAQALPDATKLPQLPDDVASEPEPIRVKAQIDTNQPASPPAEPVAATPEEPAATPPPPAPSSPDSSGMEERIKAHFDQGLGAIREQVEAVALPDGYREVFDRFSPEDLEMALRAGRWVNDRRGNPVESIKASRKARKEKQSRTSHNNGVSEDGAPN
jgi:hypothetical protein